MTDNELHAIAFVSGAFIEGQPATREEIAIALAVLAKNRRWAALGRLLFAAMVAANLERKETK